MSLSFKQAAFVREYLIDYNGTQAAIRCGYSPRSAKVTASRLLTYANVITAIREKQMGADEVRMGLADIARGDIADLMDITTAGYTFKLLIDGPNGEKIVNPKTKLIKKIKQKVVTRLGKKDDDEDVEIIDTEIELYSAHEAYRDIGKMHGLFLDKTDITSNGDQITFTITPRKNEQAD